MKKYQSHKVVEAGLITRFDLSEDAEGDDCFDLEMEGHDAGVYVIPYDWGVRIISMAADGKGRKSGSGDDAIGGYLVKYKDGYHSWSPAKEFEDGYVLLPDGAGPLTDDEMDLLQGRMLKAQSHPGRLSDESIEEMEIELPDDPWRHRSQRMRCNTCMWYVNKEAALTDQGRCRRHAPNMGGYPVVMQSDWCGDHRLA